VDKLVQVYRKNGERRWVYSHLEVQGQPDGLFPRRMYIYRFRCGDKYGVDVSSVAILCDANPDWRPNHYREELWQSEVTFKFPIVKLLDYTDRWAELEASDNPFATVVMAHLKTLETKDDEQARKQWKFWLIRRLYERGYLPQDIINLYRFIDWMMQLPKDLGREFKQEVILYEEAKQMRYITSIEQLAIEEGFDKGQKEGREEGRREGLEVAQRQLLKLLRHRFGEVTPQLVTALQRFPLAQVESLTDQALLTGSLAEFATQVEAHLATLTAQAATSPEQRPG
jgi:flagellar biosynthesis/type III secretory pathway protein FliH